MSNIEDEIVYTGKYIDKLYSQKHDSDSEMEVGSDKKVDSNRFRPSLEIWGEQYPELLYLEPRELYDKAIVGVVERINLTALCYDVVEILLICQAQGMTGEEAEEHFDFNIQGSYMGEHSPVFLNQIIKG